MKISQNSSEYTMNKISRIRRVFGKCLSALSPKSGKEGSVDETIFWLTGYNELALQQHLDNKTDCSTFFAQAPNINPNVSKITGVICGYRVEEIEDKKVSKNIIENFAFQGQKQNLMLLFLRYDCTIT